MAYYVIKYAQSIYDVAIQLYGDVAKVNQLVSDNSSVLSNGLMTQNLIGLSMSYTPPNTSMTNYFITNNIIIVSGTPVTLLNRSFNNAFNFAFS